MIYFLSCLWNKLNKNFSEKLQLSMIFVLSFYRAAELLLDVFETKLESKNNTFPDEENYELQSYL
jgi:hypothetical protein